MLHRSLAVLFALCVTASSLAAPNAPLVAPTEALTPQEQLKKFKLPPGFEIQLVASEPDINKPMNMNFDTRGRLWVSSSIEYPWPAKGKARDRITVFTDINKDGRAGSRHFFASDLNIPIGVLPLKGGKEAIAWSIPNIWKYTDTDDDGVADKREVLFGPFDFADTHGNQNAFRYHIDGWVYANHGFRNNSVNVKATGEGPVVIAMNSGNTYRFRPDGSAIELWSAGQVNPYGLTFDPWGNLFAADCHSKACTMVIRGAVYESFGKPHDGLGYGPNMTNHDHGSSGIGGIAYYAAEHFPKEYRDCLYLGNVVTGIVHRDVIKWNGSTPWVDKPADFVTCDDPWFRPVDIQLGPDGALYIADFYNCIIGHYEVDLKHPRRDRERGRIWRVVYKGEDGKAAAPKAMGDLQKSAITELNAAAHSPNIVVRTLAAQVLVDRAGEWVAADQLVERILVPVNPEVAWAFARMHPVAFNKIPWLDIIDDPRTRTYLPRILSTVQSDNLGRDLRLLRTLMGDPNAQTRRAAADALGRHPDPANIKPLLDAWGKAHEHDTTLIHTIRIALRNQIRGVGIDKLGDIKLPPNQMAQLAQIALAVPTEAAAWFAFDYVRNNEVSGDVLSKHLTHVARHVGDGRINEVAAFVRQKFEKDIEQQLVLFQSIHAGMKQRGTSAKGDSELGKWAGSLVTSLLDTTKFPPPVWMSHPLDEKKPSPSPFGLRERECDDGTKAIFIDSIVSGEQLTGIFRSQAFDIPAKLSFYICGHNGLPGANVPQVNVVRLRLVDDNSIVAQQSTPRGDIAKKHTWDLSKWAGRRGVIEIVDADTRDSYAWIGVARFEPAVVRVPAGIGNTNDRQSLAVTMAGELQLASAAPAIAALLNSSTTSLEARLAASQALAQLDRDAAGKTLAAIVQSPNEPGALRAKAAQLIGPNNTEATRAALVAAVITSPGQLQRTVALAMTATPKGSLALLDTIAAGKASPRLLQDKEISERMNNEPRVAKDARRAELVKNLPPAEDRINTLIAAHANRFAASHSAATADTATLDRGLAVYKTNCAACHKIGETGNLVGPQLNGIGVRGHDRLLEDILDPNRNVDAAFKVFIYTMKDGDIVTGMKLREEGKLLVLADAQGKEVKIATADIAETRPSALSPMPANFAEVITEKDLFDLLAFLLAQKQAEK